MGRSDTDNAEAHNAELEVPGLAEAKLELADVRREVHLVAARSLHGLVAVTPAVVRVLIERVCADENPTKRIRNEIALWREVMKGLAG